MSEADLRSVFQQLTRRLDPHPIENLVERGTPDEDLVTGQVELKWLREFPARKSTTVKLEHFSTEQKTWLKNRWAAGGGAWLVLQCKREWFVFPANLERFDQIGSNLTADELRSIAQPWFRTKPTEDELCRALTRK